MTQVLSPTPEALALASQLLHDGQLVAFPTETVYGLGANALDAKAVLNIFAAKGRPADNPLIVHVYDRAQLTPLCEVSPLAEKLMDASRLFCASAIRNGSSSFCESELLSKTSFCKNCNFSLGMLWTQSSFIQFGSGVVFVSLFC